MTSPRRQFLASSHPRNELFIMDSQGEIVWHTPLPHPQDLWMLPDGSVAAAWHHGVRRIARDGATVFDFAAPSPAQVPSLQLLPDGHWLTGFAGPCELVELDATGAVLERRQYTTSAPGIHSQFRFCRETASGTRLIPFTAEGAVREYDRAGHVLLEIDNLPTPVGVLRLPNGDTLVSMAGAIRRYTPDGSEIWQFTGNDAPGIDLAVAAGLQLLANGNLLFNNWGSRTHDDKRAAHLLEITPDKKIVWLSDNPLLEDTGQCQILDKNFTVSNECILR